MAKGDVCEICGSDKWVRKNKESGKYLCCMHYEQLRVHGRFIVKENKLCSVCNSDDCVMEWKGDGKLYCRKHYYQLYLYGEILTRTRFDDNEIIFYDNYAEILLYDKHRKEVARTKIDLEDIDKIPSCKWGLKKNKGKCYCGCKDENNKNMFLHRVIMGVLDDNTVVVDHINHDGLDNRKCNLRICTQSENMANKSILGSNKTGTIGVAWDKSHKKWCAYITVNYKRMHLGYFKEIEEAIKTRKEAEQKYFGEFTPTN
jgi:hypothetical protein